MMKHHRKLVLLTILFVLGFVPACRAAEAADFSARVVAVHEGDRLLLYHDGKQETIYLQDIDCPDPKQPYGAKAKRVTQAYVGGREVIVRNWRRGAQGRTTVEIILPDGRNLGHELLKEGFAWWRKMDSKEHSLGEIEQLVRAERKGLWADPHPIPPWQWKQAKKIRK